MQKRSSWMQPNGKLKVLSTIAMIDDIVKSIGGDNVDSYTLIQGELDPHAYQLVKGDGETLSFADVIFYNGLGLEHGPSLQAYLHKSSKSIGLGDKIREKYPERILYEKGQLDPHIWMDVSLWSETIPFIVEALSKKDPSNAEMYAHNGKELTKVLDKVHLEITEMLQQIPEQQRYLVTSHDAFNYFTKSYLAEETELANNSWKKRFAAPEGLAPESQLSVSEIKLIIDHLRKYDLHVMFPESNVSKDSIRKITLAATEIGLRVEIACAHLYADAMGSVASGDNTYIGMIMHNAKTISHYLKSNTNHKDFCLE